MVIKSIMVLGAGQMGSGIAQVCAQSGYRVYLYDIDESLLKKGVTTIVQNLKRAVDKGRIGEDVKQETLKKITETASLEIAGKVDMVIEAIVEKKEMKVQIFNALDRICPPQTIFASNTSSLSITALASATERKEKFIGMHFMNPVPVMKLVEIIRGIATSDQTYSVIEDLTKKLGKYPVEVNDFPGFVSNRILMPMINEAIYTFMEGVSTIQAIDEVMKFGMNHPMGPLALADLIGLDTCLNIMEVLYEGFSDSKYRPCPLLRKYVEAGWLGVKTGKGFYNYNH